MHARRAEAAQDKGRGRPGEVGERERARLLRRLRPGYPQVCDALVDAEGDLVRVRARARARVRVRARARARARARVRATARATVRARARARARVDAEGDHVGGDAEEEEQHSLLGEVEQTQVLPHQCVEEAGRRRHPSVGIVVVTLVVTDQAQPRQLRGGGARVRPRGRRGTRLCSEEDSGRVWSSGWQWLAVAGPWLAALWCGKAWRGLGGVPGHGHRQARSGEVGCEAGGGGRRHLGGRRRACTRIAWRKVRPHSPCPAARWSPPSHWPRCEHGQPSLTLKNGRLRGSN